MPAILKRAAIYAPEAFENGHIPYLLQFIGRSTEDVIKLHIRYNFIGLTNIWFLTIPCGIFTLFYYIFIPYITITMLMVFTPKKIGLEKISGLLRIIVFQFICLLPMWTVLSCDIVRVSVYWIMSSLQIWLILNEMEINNMFFNRYNILIKKTAQKVFFSWVPNKFILTVLALCIGITLFNPSIRGVIGSSIIYNIYSFFHRVFAYLF